MAKLSTFEKTKLEHLFEMGSGWVLDFSNKTMHAFFADELDIDIYDDKYALYSDSKAKRRRAFWSVESEYLVGKSIQLLIEHRGTICFLPLEQVRLGCRLLARSPDHKGVGQEPGRLSITPGG